MLNQLRYTPASRDWTKPWRTGRAGTLAGLLLGGLLPILASGDSTMLLTSSVFTDLAAIPTRYTCEGEDVSPPLAWSGLPENTRSLVLIVDDPDAPDPAAPRMTWAHWVLYNLPPMSPGLPEGVSKAALPAETREGLNDWKRTGYGGPCPPIGRHRYVHTLYALDAELPDLGRPTKGDVVKAMEGHVLASASLVGTYQKQGRK